MKPPVIRPVARGSESSGGNAASRGTTFSSSRIRYSADLPQPFRAETAEPMARADLTDQKQCPKCGSEERLFRSRKAVAASAEAAAGVETKYRCRSCGKDYRVCQPVEKPSRR
jgi:DNA-directed RNA polymerase subunit RPC12/RpoP